MPKKKEEKQVWEVYRQSRLIDEIALSSDLSEEQSSRYIQDEIGYPPDIKIKLRG